MNNALPTTAAIGDLISMGHYFRRVDSIERFIADEDVRAFGDDFKVVVVVPKGAEGIRLSGDNVNADGTPFGDVRGWTKAEAI